MKNLLILLSLASLTACSSMGAKETRQMNEVRCSGFLNWEVCDEQAKQMCDKGYDIAYKEENLIEQKRVMYFYCE